MVDIQNDFCEEGSFSVPDADAIVPLVNQLQAKFDLILATKDWHPADHASFASNHHGAKVGDVVNLGDHDQILWPDHCVQDTHGASFHEKLQVDTIAKIFHKGTDSNIDSYSASYDNARLRATGIEQYLKAQAISDVYIVGLATDYCVKFSALDIARAGFNVYVVADACRGMELIEGAVATAFEEMCVAGVQVITSASL